MTMGIGTMAIAKWIGTGYTFDGEVGEWYMLPDNGTYMQLKFFALNGNGNVIEQTCYDPREDFDFIPAFSA